LLFDASIEVFLGPKDIDLTIIALLPHGVMVGLGDPMALARLDQGTNISFLGAIEIGGEGDISKGGSTVAFGWPRGWQASV